ncbi:probable inactive receptor kinase [Tanacetum coccineum]
MQRRFRLQKTCCYYYYYKIIKDFGFQKASESKHKKYTAFELCFWKQSQNETIFGVLLLELLTGKAHLPSSRHDEVVDLPRWVWFVVREEWTAKVFNEELIKYQHAEEQILQIGLACVARVPDMRPSIDDVIKMIVDLRSEDLSEHQDSSEDNRSKSSNVHTL